MKRPEKEAVVAQLTEQFRNADAVYLTEYREIGRASCRERVFTMV